MSSLDALRGLVIAVMVLVNDAGDAAAAPRWLQHAAADVDGMTVADIVFPAFLFVVGMSVPLALRRQLERGATVRSILPKVVGRTLSLLVMGVFMVGRAENTGWSPQLWTGAMYVCFIATWAAIDSDDERTLRAARWVRGAGVIGLLLLASIYRGPDGEHLVMGPLFDATERVWLRHEWWGILGSLGWAYLATSVAYLAVRHRPAVLIWGVPLGVLAYVAEQHGCLTPRAVGAGPIRVALEPLLWVHSHVSFGRQLGIHLAISMAGCTLATLLPRVRHARRTDERRYAASVLVFAAALGIAGVVLEPHFGISKRAGTPSWALYSCAWTAAVWALVYAAIEVRGWRRWSGPISAAGANALLAYFLHPLIRGALGVTPGLEWLLVYKTERASEIVAVAGTLVMTIAVVWATSSLTRRGLRLRT